MRFAIHLERDVLMGGGGGVPRNNTVVERNLIYIMIFLGGRGHNFL